MTKETVSLGITTEINQKIETAVANRHYRSKSDLMRVGIEKVLAELELKEQMMNKTCTRTD